MCASHVCPWFSLVFFWGGDQLVVVVVGDGSRSALWRLCLGAISRCPSAAPHKPPSPLPSPTLLLQSVAWLESFLATFKGTVVAITHDRYFLDNVAGWILELDRGQGIPFEGNYSGG